MKVSQIVVLSAALALQAQACVRVRVDRYIHDTYGTIQDMRLYDNDSPAKAIPFSINFRTSDDENILHLDGYTVKLEYRNSGRTHPSGGRVTYPNGYSRDLQGKTQTAYVDGKGWTHDVYCFSDNYDNCGDYVCGV